MLRFLGCQRETARLLRISRWSGDLAGYGSGAAGRENAACRRLDGIPRKRHSGANWTKAFDASLQELGWNNGRNIQLDYRWGGPNPDRLRADAQELVRLNPDVLVAVATPALIATQHATRSIPIVFANVADPVGQGLIASFARPGGNTTGFGAFDFSMAGKWVQAIKEIAPSVTRIGVISTRRRDPITLHSCLLLRPPQVRLASKRFLWQFMIPIISLKHWRNWRKNRTQALLCFRPSCSARIEISLSRTVARLRLPTVYPFSFFAQSGGLLSYGFDVRDMLKRAAGYVDRILRGAKVSDLPAQQPTKFEFIVNLKAAKALGLTVLPTLLDRADEVIE